MRHCAGGDDAAAARVMSLAGIRRTASDRPVRPWRQADLVGDDGIEPPTFSV
jgi:hypothetical protein